MEPLKDRLAMNFYGTLASAFAQTSSDFDSEGFLNKAEAEYEQLELMDRVKLATTLCREFLPRDYQTAVELIKRTVEIVPAEDRGLVCLFAPDYVGRYGMEHFDYSMEALRHFTPVSSAEIAIREYIVADRERAMGHILKWVHDDNHHVRRLASEGTRPRLPWAFQLKEFIEDPSHTLPILEALKADDSEYVRRSVGNHLNDISRDHPEWMLDLVETWDSSDEKIAWVIKRGARTLIKQGHPRSFALFGFEPDPQLWVDSLRIEPAKVRIGENMTLFVELGSDAARAQKLSVDFAIHFVKKNGKTSPKVFKLREIELPPGESRELRNTVSFVNMTTRQHFAGTHTLDIIVNGKVFKSQDFEVQE